LQAETRLAVAERLQAPVDQTLGAREAVRIQVPVLELRMLALELLQMAQRFDSTVDTSQGLGMP